MQTQPADCEEACWKEMRRGETSRESVWSSQAMAAHEVKWHPKKRSPSGRGFVSAIMRNGSELGIQSGENLPTEAIVKLVVVGCTA